jgi:hypothetical protein
MRRVTALRRSAGHPDPWPTSFRFKAGREGFKPSHPSKGCPLPPYTLSRAYVNCASFFVLRMRRIWRCRNVWVRGAAVPIAVLALLSCQDSSVTSVQVSPNPKGVVTGGIMPCGMIAPSGVLYVAGTVTVLKGQETLRSTGPSTYVTVFPTTVVTQQSVVTNGTYRFVLDPGQYVLRARYSPPGDVAPFVNVTLRAGTNLKVDIPNMCK